SPSLAAAYASSIVSSSAGGAPADAGAVVPAPTIAKKTSKWKLSFGKSSSSSQNRATLLPAPALVQMPAEVIDISRESIPEVQQHPHQYQQSQNARADEFGSVEFEASPALSSAPSQPQIGSVAAPSDPWPRGRSPAVNVATWGPSTVSVNSQASGSGSGSTDRWPQAERNVSPNSTRTGRSGLVSGSSSASVSGLGAGAASAVSLSHSSVSSNWRNSTLTSSSAASAFTRYSNGSLRSVSTVATSVSGGSWRSPSSASLANAERKPGYGGPASIASRSSEGSGMKVPPPNVKIMTGVPWALDELPRQLHPNPSGDIFGGPPGRK
ncbi:hypothetical protein EW145_g8581, partial [Phellinidium pouzarii]